MPGEQLLSSSPLVSIVMPAFNAARFLDVAVRSVLEQTWRNWELLIVNDGSTDGSREYLDALSDPRIRVFHQDNRGVSAARNAALAAVRGAFITFLDADDALTPRSLESRAHYLLDHDDVDLVDGCRSFRDGDLGMEERRFVPGYRGLLFPRMIRLDARVFNHISVMLRTRLLGPTRFRVGMTHCEDLLFFIELASRQDIRCGSVDELVFLYRTGHGSAMQRTEGLRDGYRHLIDEVRRLPRVSPLDVAFLRVKVAATVFMCWRAARGLARAPAAAAGCLLGGVGSKEYSSRASAFRGAAAIGGNRAASRRFVQRREVAILTFHRVSDESDELWPPMPVRTLERMIDWLAHETVLVPVDRLHDVEAYPSKPLVCITFDDGYADFFDNALPILARYGVPVLHNICPGLIDEGGIAWTQVVSRYVARHAGTRLTLPAGPPFVIPEAVREHDFLKLLVRLYEFPHALRSAFVADLGRALDDAHSDRLMSWDQVRTCQAAGVRFGSHGMWHSHLPTIEDEALLRDEIAGSRRRIHEETGTQPDVFAFPSGFFDARSLGLVSESGYRFALLCEDQAVRHPLSRLHSCTALTRINMANGVFAEERLRALGFHRTAKRLLRGTPQVFKDPAFQQWSR